MRLLLLFLALTCCSANEHPALSSITVNRYDTAAKQRGAGIFFNYCGGCHSLKYARYDGLASDLKIFNEKGHVDKDMVLKYLNYANEDYHSPIIANINPEHAQAWFGKLPPDLSLVSRVRGNNWIYSYLKTFYVDPSRPAGVNNLVYPNVGMPHVLQELQGVQYPVMDDKGHVIGVSHDSSVTRKQVEHYDGVISDLVHFLDYVGEPHKQERLALGRFVMLYLVVFAVVAYLYYKEMWKDIKS